MALKSRSRSGTWGASWKFSNNQPPTIYSGTYEVERDSLDVSVNNQPGGEHPFESNHSFLDGSIGSALDPTAAKKFTASGPSNWLVQSPGYPTISTPTDAGIWAMTNPSRPTVLLPVFWLELREIPDMIRQAGRILSHARNWRDYIRPGTKGRDLATANLAWQFGWAPLIGDLWKIASFQNAVDKRRKEIDRLYSKGGLTRRVGLGEASLVTPPFGATANFGSYKNFNVTAYRSSHAKAWAVVKWRPTNPSALPPSDGLLRAHLTGLHPSHILANVWEALPWSWLIDWFSNVGDVIQASNRLIATPVRGSKMIQYTSTVSHSSSTNGADILSPGTAKFQKNTRFPIGGSTLQASIPILGAGQLSILGSLAYLRRPK